jgi:hypothetical protein
MVADWRRTHEPEMVPPGLLVGCCLSCWESQMPSRTIVVTYSANTGSPSLSIPAPLPSLTVSIAALT